MMIMTDDVDLVLNLKMWELVLMQELKSYGFFSVGVATSTPKEILINNSGRKCLFIVIVGCG